MGGSVLTTSRALLVVLASCSSRLNPEFCAAHPTDQRCPTHEIDAATAIDGDKFDGNDAIAPAICVGADKLRVCLPTLPSGDRTFNAEMVNTSSSLLCLDQQPIDWLVQGQKPACVIAAENFTLTGMITLRGDQPLVLVATGNIAIDGTVNVAAKHDSTQIPAGFSTTAADCPTAMQQPVASTNGGGGGAGGTLGARGGDGGTGNNANTPGGKSGDPSIAILHAGCGGQTGGDGDLNGGGGGIGGFAGGALYLVAGGMISVANNASINASGAGGSGGGHRSGGGGGGSGGMLILWAGTSINFGANVGVYANGGGGASGGTDNSNGFPGTDPPSAFNAPTGPTNGAAGAGGTGAYLSNDATAATGGQGGQGGGGGGGGAGIIYANHALAAQVVSPPIQSIP